MAEDKEPFAVVELGTATECSFQENIYSIGPSASVEFPVIKDWLEIETGISPLFRSGHTEWQTDLLFKKPFTMNEHVEFMIGAGPQFSYTTAGGGTQIASEFALEWMISLPQIASLVGSSNPPIATHSAEGMSKRLA
jgi:hypothetical protein